MIKVDKAIYDAVLRIYENENRKEWLKFLEEDLNNIKQTKGIMKLYWVEFFSDDRFNNTQTYELDLDEGEIDGETVAVINWERVLIYRLICEKFLLNLIKERAMELWYSVNQIDDYLTVDNFYSIELQDWYKIKTYINNAILNNLRSLNDLEIDRALNLLKI